MGEGIGTVLITETKAAKDQEGCGGRENEIESDDLHVSFELPVGDGGLELAPLPLARGRKVVNESVSKKFAGERRGVELLGSLQEVARESSDARGLGQTRSNRHRERIERAEGPKVRNCD